MSHFNNEESQPIVEEPYSDDDEKKNALTVSKPIWQQNHTISKKLERLMKIMTLIEAFKNHTSGLASAFAELLQQNSQELVATQATLRQCLQSVLKVESYKSATMDKQQKETWDLINAFRKEIRKAVINVNDVTAEWFGFLTLLRHGLVYFYESMTNGSTPSNSIAVFQQAAREFCKFYKDNVNKFHAVRERSEEAMQKIMQRFSGGQAITNALKQRKNFQEFQEEKREKLRQIQREKLDKMTAMNQKIAILKGELAQYDVQLKYERKEISNLDKAQRDAAYKALKSEKEAATKTNFQREERTTNVFGMELWNYYKNVYTGEHDRYKSIADRYHNMRDKACNQKDLKTAIIKSAAQHREETQQKIYAERTVIKAMNNEYDEKIKQIKDEIKKAKETYESAETEVQNAIKKYSVNKHSIEEFLQSTNALSQESLKALEATKKVEVAIKTFSKIVQAKCITVFRIDSFFLRDGVNLEPLVEPLNKNGFVTLRDIECDDEKEFNEHILPLIKDIPDINKRQIYKMKKLSYTKKRDWKDEEEKLADTNVKNLMNQVLPLSVFFPSLRDRLKLACKMLSFRDATDNTETLKMLPIEIEELENEDAKNRELHTLEIEDMIKNRENEDAKNREMIKKKPKNKSKKKPKKKPKKQTKKKRKGKYSSSSEEESSSSSDESLSSDDESSSEHGRKNKKKKHKKRRDKHDRRKKDRKIRKKKYSSDSDTDETDSDDDTESNTKQTIITQMLLLQELVGRNKAKCLDDEFDTVKIPFDGDEWYGTLRKLLKKGKKKGVDVKLKVSTINNCQYSITNAFLDKEKKNQKPICVVLAVEEIDGNIAKCMDDHFNTVDVKFDEKWGSELVQLCDEVINTEETVRLEVSYMNNGQNGSDIEYTILKVYKES